MEFEPGPFIETQTGRESLRCALTPVEQLAYKDALVQALQELEQAEADLKSLKSTFKKDMDAKAAQIKSLSQKLSNGYEFRPVEIRIVRDYRAKTVTHYRTDTDEKIRERTMNADEAQKSLLPPPESDQLPPSQEPDQKTEKTE